jgi:hypothetical protein
MNRQPVYISTISSKDGQCKQSISWEQFMLLDGYYSLFRATAKCLETYRGDYEAKGLPWVEYVNVVLTMATKVMLLMAGYRDEERTVYKGPVWLMSSSGLVTPGGLKAELEAASSGSSALAMDEPEVMVIDDDDDKKDEVKVDEGKSLGMGVAC